MSNSVGYAIPLEASNTSEHVKLDFIFPWHDPPSFQHDVENPWSLNDKKKDLTASQLPYLFYIDFVSCDFVCK